MGNFWSGVRSGSSEDESDLIMANTEGGAMTAADEPFIYPGTFLRHDENLVYIRAPTDSPFVVDVMKFQQWLLDTRGNDSEYLRTLPEKYSLDNLAICTPEELIQHIQDIPNERNQEDEEAPVVLTVYNRQSAPRSGREFSRVNLLAAYIVAYTRHTLAEKDKEIAALKETIAHREERIKELENAYKPK